MFKDWSEYLFYYTYQKYSSTLIKEANECTFAALKLNSIFTLCTLKSKVDKGGANLHLQAVWVVGYNNKRQKAIEIGFLKNELHTMISFVREVYSQSMIILGRYAFTLEKTECNKIVFKHDSAPWSFHHTHLGCSSLYQTLTSSSIITLCRQIE